jgi:pyrimidine-nucleoside phosphorylase
MLMAMYLRGLNDDETARLTLAMAASGDQLDLSAVPGVKVDKHSTGGVADTTTLVLAPLVAACGVPVVKMSGRGLGFTGGTIDKLESIPGFQVDLSTHAAIAQARRIGVAILAQTDRLTPADKRLYALRDVTGTVESIPLIAASIMSKKLAAGADAIVLDVKCGNGAFMANPRDAGRLARTMVAIGRQVGRRVTAVISRMDQPLGNRIGNTLEVLEAIDVLKGRVGGDLLAVTIKLGSEMLRAGLGVGAARARALLRHALASGAALDRLRALIEAQGGDPRIIDEPERLPQPTCRQVWTAPADGYLMIDTAALGRLFVELGGGRRVKTDSIDPTAGLTLHARLGEPIKAGQTLLTMQGADPARIKQVAAEISQALTLVPHQPVVRPVLVSTIR